ncbi:unnamed protein product [Ilex paraguariensis]|uniref:Uncharacterized protein n=1 Tax=Ilex paraguariensis TaxID=185542 RepID=A0ABC8TWN3_9AQUA
MVGGEDLASSIQRGSLDWERALRCIRHALRNTPSPDWWRRVLVAAPCYRSLAPGPTPGAVFTFDMICEATIDRIVELLKLTNSVVVQHIYGMIICFLVLNASGTINMLTMGEVTGYQELVEVKAMIELGTLRGLGCLGSWNMLGVQKETFDEKVILGESDDVGQLEKKGLVRSWLGKGLTAENKALRDCSTSCSYEKAGKRFIELNEVITAEKE